MESIGADELRLDFSLLYDGDDSVQLSPCHSSNDHHAAAAAAAAPDTYTRRELSSLGSRRRRSLPQTPVTAAMEWKLAKDHPLAGDLEVLAAERLALEVLAGDRLMEIRRLEESATEHWGQIDVLQAERDHLAATVRELTTRVEQLSLELECIKIAPQAAHPSPDLSRHSSPVSRRSTSPARSAVIAELKQLLENNQVTAKRLKDELNLISRKSREEVSSVAGLQTVYNELTSCCAQLESSLHQSAADFHRLFTTPPPV